MNLNIFKWSTPSIIVFLILIPCFIVGGFAAYDYLTAIDGRIKILTPANITASPAFLDWGNATVGETVTRSVFLTNTGQKATMMLDFVYTLPAHISITSSNSNPIAPNATNEVVFTLTVEEGAVVGEHVIAIQVNHGTH